MLYECRTKNHGIGKKPYLHCDQRGKQFIVHKLIHVAIIYRTHSTESYNNGIRLMLCMCVINHVKCTQFTLMVIKREEQLVTEGCGSACTTQTKFASKPSPEWIQDFSVTISGGSEIRGGLLNYFSIHKIILQNWFLRLHTYSAIIAKMYVCVCQVQDGFWVKATLIENQMLLACEVVCTYTYCTWRWW